MPTHFRCFYVLFAVKRALAVFIHDLSASFDSRRPTFEAMIDETATFFNAPGTSLARNRMRVPRMRDLHKWRISPKSVIPQTIFMPLLSSFSTASSTTASSYATVTCKGLATTRRSSGPRRRFARRSGELSTGDGRRELAIGRRDVRATRRRDKTPRRRREGWKTIRLFVSSTFTEREALKEVRCQGNDDHLFHYVIN